MERFDAPIPGQSLTKEPKNYPWERPPETADPDEAIVHHLTRVGQPRVMNSILDGVGQGIPVSLLTEMMLTGAVMQGIHTIDISMMIAPVVHDYIVNLLEEEGVEFKEFFPDEDDEDVLRNIAVSGAITGLNESSSGKDDLESTDVEKVLTDDQEVTEDAPKRGAGLMSRGEAL